MNRANSCGLCKASEARDELVAGIMGHVHLRWWEHPGRAHLLDLDLRRHKLPLELPRPALLVPPQHVERQASVVLGGLHHAGVKRALALRPGAVELRRERSLRDVARVAVGGRGGVVRAADAEPADHRVPRDTRSLRAGAERGAHEASAADRGRELRSEGEAMGHRQGSEDFAIWLENKGELYAAGQSDTLLRMKALTVQQPFAGLIAAGRKTIELRRWPTKLRGLLTICAGARAWSEAAVKEFGDGPRGVVLCEVDVVGCRPATEADRGAACVGADKLASLEGWYAWELAEARAVPQRPVRGMPGLFTLPQR